MPWSEARTVVSDRRPVIRRRKTAGGVILAALASKLPLNQRKAGIILCRFVIAICAILFATSAQILAAQNPAAQRDVVVLDAAHGGDDAGAGLGSETEKAYTLALSVRLRSLLMARGFTVVTTREADTTVDTEHRDEIANHANAMACLSLHATEAGSGVHVFVSSIAPAREERFVPWKTAQAQWVTRSVALAGVLNSALNHASLTVTIGRVGLPVIDSMTCPAVAVEIAPQKPADGQEGDTFGDPGTQAHIAEALAAALVEWRSPERGAHQP
jgi:N-acetylmuramoyl-L-alanine amidase